MPPDPPSGSRLHLRAPPLILPLLRHCQDKQTQKTAPLGATISLKVNDQQM